MSANAMANYAGQAFSAALGLVVVPVYIRLLGVHAYGLIGFYASMQAILSLADPGLSAGLHREFARLSPLPNQRAKLPRILDTLQRASWGVAGAIAILVSFASGAIARHWIDSESIGIRAVTASVALMGAVAALQFPLNLYTAGLQGMQRQRLASLITSGTALARASLGVIVLIFVERSIVAFFLSQLVATMAGSVTAAMSVWNALPAHRERPGLRRAEWAEIAPFAAGMSLASVLYVARAQGDKVLLSKSLPLDEFAFYSIASTLAWSLSICTTPLQNAVAPRLTALLSTQSRKEANTLYLTASELFATVLFPIGITIVFYAESILALWTRNVAVAKGAGNLLALQTIAAIIGLLCNAPQMLLVAAGKVRPLLVLHACVLAIFVPTLAVFAARWGAVGAASATILASAVSVLLLAAWAYKEVSWSRPEEWYSAVGKPAFGVVACGAAWWMLTKEAHGVRGVLAIASAWFVSTLIALALAPRARGALRRAMTLPG